VPVERLPEWAQILGFVTPLYYANEILQDLIRGAGLMDNKFNLLILPLYGLLVIGLAALSLREKE